MLEKNDPDNPQVSPWVIRSHQTVYENAWIRLVHHDVTRPDGEAGVYGVVHYRHRAVGILPIDEEGYTWLVGQYRFPLRRYSWEIPEGGCPEGESTLSAAQRELREETGLLAAEWTILGQSHLSNSVSDEAAILYLATGLTLTAPEPEGTEVLARRRVPFTVAREMALDGRITDAMSVLAILLYDQRLVRSS